MYQFKEWLLQFYGQKWLLSRTTKKSPDLILIGRKNMNVMKWTHDNEISCLLTNNIPSLYNGYNGVILTRDDIVIAAQEIYGKHETDATFLVAIDLKQMPLKIIKSRVFYKNYQTVYMVLIENEWEEELVVCGYCTSPKWPPVPQSILGLIKQKYYRKEKLLFICKCDEKFTHAMIKVDDVLWNDDDQDYDLNKTLQLKCIDY